MTRRKLTNYHRLTPLETYDILERTRGRVARLRYRDPRAQAEADALEAELYEAEEHLLDNLHVELRCSDLSLASSTRCRG